MYMRQQFNLSFTPLSVIGEAKLKSMKGDVFMVDKSVRVNTTISKMLNNQLTSYSEKYGLTKSAIVSQALVSFFRNNDMMERGISVLFDAVKDNPQLLNTLIEESKK